MSSTTHQQQPSVEARERLLGAALVLFTQQGYAATSVREICLKAGVTKPVLYYYFKSKEGLYLQLMEDSHSRFEAMLADLGSIGGSIRQRVIRFCESVFDTTVQQLPLVQLIYSIYYGTPQGAPPFDLEQYYDRMLLVISTLIQEGIDAGEIREGNVNDMVWASLACMSIAIEEQLCHCNPRLDRSAMTRMLHIVFDGLAVR
ncbi:MAG: TetR/AcrR family transcriptional regulator [Desulfuromonadaceae bacterium]|nr:TetR/AcrR family transcriptional regulator [Desulfuromonadaceae bacterium]